MRAGGKVHVPPELAQELLEVSDQYMLESLKHLCEQTITEQVGGQGRGEGRSRRCSCMPAWHGRRCCSIDTPVAPTLVLLPTLP